MGKGNLILGYGRGKMGSVVFTRQQGKQVFKAYNDKPLNPRSTYQMTQRAKFLNANKFYSRGVQNLFRFAYENKRPDESDFNAFMRNNLRNSFLISQTCFRDAAYPAIGNWLLSKGSLESTYAFSEEDGIYIRHYMGAIEEPTWAQFSSSMKTHGYKNGDIVTILFIKINEGYNPNNTPTITPLSELVPLSWQIRQLVINDQDKEINTTWLSKLGLKWDVDNTDLKIETGANILGAGAMIVSRITGNRLKVSTTYLTPNENLFNVMKKAAGDDYINEVLESWGATTPAVLQGTEI